ncbi:hypothetical protein BESB_000800 [Besnoitia besnoiti]|uniref:Uncharacterized protein n=1 Tax=Besnoitia besnoiti TaxID=94643 RepID=A0A2A9MGT4_BESBE|nr:hypothetical protein BESB_000800 [Besnoitia besnoiti]PFH37738.1 hypothetical protein BESB_000800 [Besnoitia besnoiti]
MTTTGAGSASMSMESKLNCSLDDLVKMQRQAATNTRNAQRKNTSRGGAGPKTSVRGRGISKRGGGSKTSTFPAGVAGAGRTRGAGRRGRGGRGGFPGPARNRPAPNSLAPAAKKKQNPSQSAAPKVSLAQRLAQPLENSIFRNAGKSGAKKPGAAAPRRVAGTTLSAQRKLMRPGAIRARGGLTGRPARLPPSLRRARGAGAVVGGLAARSGAGAWWGGRGVATATRGRKLATVRKAGGINKQATAVRKANTAAARLKAVRPVVSRPLNTSFNRRAQGAGPASASRRPRAESRSARRGAASPGSRVPVVRGSSTQQPVPRTVPSATDVELMSKIKIMATLDKVPPPMAAQRGMAVTPPQAMVDEHGYMNNGNGKNNQAAHLPYNGCGGGSLSDRFSKYGSR